MMVSKDPLVLGGGGGGRREGKGEEGGHHSLGGGNIGVNLETCLTILMD